MLALRARRPHAFAGTYEPLEAGVDACAFVRGGEVLVVVGVRDGWRGATIAAPSGEWRDVLGAEREARGLTGSEPLADLLDEHGVAVFERLA